MVRDFVFAVDACPVRLVARTRIYTPRKFNPPCAGHFPSAGMLFAVSLPVRRPLSERQIGHAPCATRAARDSSAIDGAGPTAIPCAGTPCAGSQRQRVKLCLLELSALQFRAMLEHMTLRSIPDNAGTQRLAIPRFIPTCTGCFPYSSRAHMRLRITLRSRYRFQVNTPYLITPTSVGRVVPGISTPTLDPTPKVYIQNTLIIANGSVRKGAPCKRLRVPECSPNRR